MKAIGPRRRRKRNLFLNSSTCLLGFNLVSHSPLCFVLPDYPLNCHPPIGELSVSLQLLFTCSILLIPSTFFSQSY